MTFSVNNPPTRKQFLQNMEQKIEDPDFQGDIYALLRPGVEYEPEQAYAMIKNELIEKL